MQDDKGKFIELFDEPFKKMIPDFLKKNITAVFLMLLTAILTAIYFPTFFNPPRSDWWETFYFFHSVYASPNPNQWLNILNSDCFGHVTFRPLSHLFLYFQHLVFGANFYYLQVFNFFLYLLSILLLYRLAVSFVKDTTLAAVSIGFFSLLFSHFDIVSWTAHSYLILGFCALLGGFILYLKFLSAGKKYLLFCSGLLFLTGMLCYESFIIWPFAVIFLTKEDSPRLKASRGPFILSIFILYISIFFLTRAIDSYADSWLQTHRLILQLSSSHRVLESLAAASFGILYNGIFVNIFPGLALPVNIDHDSSNIELAWALGGNPYISLYMGASFFILLALIVYINIRLSRLKQTDILKKLNFLIFLAFSFVLFLSHMRFFSNREYLSNFRQFRYQYVPNACLVLAALLFFDGFFKKESRKRVFLYCILFVLAISNISATISSISVESGQLAPLSRMLNNIRNGIRNGQINAAHRLYLDDDIADKLPVMCWNRDMGKFMKGTYQWLFNKREIGYFSDTEQGSEWVIDKKNLSVVRRREEVPKR